MKIWKSNEHYVFFQYHSQKKYLQMIWIVRSVRCLVVPRMLGQISSPHFESQLLFRAVPPSVGHHPSGQVVEQVESLSADISLTTYLRWKVGRWTL